MSDYARLDILYNNGGIYLDTDVELLKNLDSLLCNKCYMGMELPKRVNTGVGFGSEKNSIVLKNNMNMYNNISFFNKGKYNEKTCIEYTMECLESMGIDLNGNDLVYTEDITIYPMEYFCPFNLITQKLLITNNTISIHHYEGSWKRRTILNKKLMRKTIKYKILLKKFINFLFGEKAYDRLKKLL